MLVGGNDGAGHFRALEQFDVALRHEVGVDFLPHLAGTVWVLLRQPDPFDRRMARHHLAAEQTDAAAADDGEADALGRLLHAGLAPDRFFSLNFAIPEIVSLVSGRSTGSLR